MLKCLDYPYEWSVISRKNKQLQRELLENPRHGFIEKKIAVLGGSTTFEVTKTLNLFCLKKGIKAHFWESDFGLYYDDMVFENPELMQFSPDIVYIHTSLRNIKSWPQLGDSEKVIQDKLNYEFEHLKAIWKKAAQHNFTVIQNNFELPFYRSLGNLDGVRVDGKTKFINDLNQMIVQYAHENKSFLVNDINYLSASLGLNIWNNEEIWQSYKYALSFQAIPHLCAQISSIVAALFGKTQKALILDLDNTLWGGVIGDDGSSGIKIGMDTPEGEGFSQLQSYILELKNRGIMLAVCSKNEEQNALEGFRRSDSVLKEQDFLEFRANWNLKSTNITDIIKKMNIGEESFVYLDDSAFERSEVSQTHKKIIIPEVSTSPIKTLQMLDREGFFEPVVILDEDLKRNSMYQSDRQRDTLKNQFDSNDEFLQSLAMSAEIKPFSEMYLDRITQLINKTNQFNLTTKRYTIEDIKKMLNDPHYVHLYGRLVDRFGDNGLTAVIIGRDVGTKTLEIDSWLMSCRVFKRGFEYQLFQEFVRLAQQKGYEKIRGVYKPTAKNKIVADIYVELGFKPLSQSPEGSFVFELNLKDFKEKKYYIEVQP